jgi:hypothetical protein
VKEVRLLDFSGSQPGRQRSPLDEKWSGSGSAFLVRFEVVERGTVTTSLSVSDFVLVPADPSPG